MSGIKKNIHGAVYRRMICEVIWVLVGNLMMAFGVAAFISPLGFICGGATGIGRALQYWFHIPLSGALGLLNIISWIIGLLFLGKKLAAGTLLSSFFQPVFLEIFLHLMQQVTWTQDMLLAAIIAGGINGAGLGIVMRAGASTGGLDIPALMGEKYLLKIT